MITKEQLLASMRHETRVIQHLATKIPQGRLDWRPTPGQRSMLELLRYLAHCAILPATACVRGNWDHAEAMAAETGEIRLEEFAAAMDRQMERLEALFAEFTEEEARTRDAQLPWGAPTKLGIGLVDMGLKPLVAYRMQLFLYAKESGASDIGAANCWVGRDPKPAG